jgi:hypothetical protein
MVQISKVVVKSPIFHSHISLPLAKIFATEKFNSLFIGAQYLAKVRQKLKVFNRWRC